MGIRDLRQALRPRPRPSSARGLVVAALGVAGVVLGLLAMHSLTISSPHSEMSMAAHSVETAALASTESESHGCVGECSPDHSMTESCILALAFGALVLAGAAVLSRWSAVTISPARIPRVGPMPAGPAPPSLLLLSISRT
jgi:hypothetical protein